MQIEEARHEVHTEFCCGNRMENTNLEDQERDGRAILCRFLWKNVVGDGCNGLRMMCHRRL